MFLMTCAFRYFSLPSLLLAAVIVPVPSLLNLMLEARQPDKYVRTA